MIPKKPAPDLVRGGHRFSETIMLKKRRRGHASTAQFSRRRRRCLSRKTRGDLMARDRVNPNARNRFAPADRLDRRSHRHSGEIPGAFDFRLFQQNRPLADVGKSESTCPCADTAMLSSVSHCSSSPMPFMTGVHRSTSLARMRRTSSGVESGSGSNPESSRNV